VTVRRFALGAVGAIGSVLFIAASAWACVSGPSINLSTVNAKPGEEVQLTMRDFRKLDPVVVRWNDLGGPVLATFENKGGTQGTPFTERITIPADAKPGSYVLVFTQTAPDGKLSQMPVRALVTVTGPAGTNPVLGAPVGASVTDRPVTLATQDESISGSTLALIALGVGGVGMFLAGMAALFSGRRTHLPQPAPARR
jgi:hypothetical protein